MARSFISGGTDGFGRAARALLDERIGVRCIEASAKRTLSRGYRWLPHCSTLRRIGFSRFPYASTTHSTSGLEQVRTGST